MFENGFPRAWSTIKKLALLFRAVVNAVAPVLKTVTGAIIHITDALARPAQSLKVNFSPVQSGSGDPSPDNIRPISGWTECKVYVSPTNDPDDATVYTIDLDGTRYGGTLDVTSGKLTVDRRYVLKPSCGNPLNQTNPAVILSLSVQAAVGVNGTANSKLISNCAKTVSANYQYTNSVIAVALNSTSQVRLSVPGLTTKAQYEAWIEDNNFEIVYPLAAPIEVNLTPTEITLFAGENNLWSDANGNLELTYLADGNTSEIEALNILLGGQYSNNHGEDEPTDREALNILLGGNER